MATTKPEANTSQEAPENKKRAAAKPTIKSVEDKEKAGIQEARDLRTLVKHIVKQNDDKEAQASIHRFAKETLKIVAEAQNMGSEAFRKEATKTLVKLRTMVEDTKKLSDVQRNKLIAKMDTLKLDGESKTEYLISMAKHQAKGIRAQAVTEMKAEKLKASNAIKLQKETAAAEIAELRQKSKESLKIRKEEQESKFKEMRDAHKLQHTKLMEAAKADIEAKKLKLKEQKDDHKKKVEKDALDFKEKKEKQKARIEEAKANLEKQKQEFKQQKDQWKLNFDNLKQQQKEAHEQRKAALDQQKQDQEAKHKERMLDLQQGRDDLKIQRASAAVKIKQLKTDLRDNHKVKLEKLSQEKQNHRARNKERIQKIRDMTTEHKIRLKKIEETAKLEILERKNAMKRQMVRIKDKAAARDKAADSLSGKINDGIMEANPLLHASIEIMKGVKGHLDQRKRKKELNLIQKGQNQPTRAPNPTPNATPAPSSPQAAAQSSSGGNGGLLSMLPTVSGIVSSIGSLFSGIVGAFGKVGSLVAGGAKFLPIIGTVAAVVGGIYSFIEGFNDASSLFGEKVADGDYTKRLYAGFTNVFGSIIGVFDTVSGWLGFDTDLEGSFKKNAVKLFDNILSVFKSVAGGLGKLLEYIPGMGGVAKQLKEYSNSSGSLSGQEVSKSAAINDKTREVNNLKDEVDAKKIRGGQTTVVADNSIKQNSTTIVQTKMDTRNNDRSVNLYSYGTSRA